jgi:hypothetical protein
MRKVNPLGKGEQVGAPEPPVEFPNQLLRAI